MKRTLLMYCALLAMSGCSLMPTDSNEPPEADIVSISPTQAEVGEVVTFVGQGADPDGEVVGYSWRSDLDGELSGSATFQTDSLSVGNHVITFAVQDENDTWSTAVRSSVNVSPATGAATDLPIVQSFEASTWTVPQGETVTLSWSVSNASSVSIEPGIGPVPGEGLIDVTPDATTTYILVASGADSTVTANVTVTVAEAGNSVTLSAEEDLCGYIRSSGVERTIGIYVGDDDADREIQGFLTYRISSIPDDAVITRVVLDLSTYDLPYESPFPELGCLRAFEHEYSSLGGQFWTADATDPIGEWCSLAELDVPPGVPGLRDALQDNLDEHYLQFRLQFSDGTSDWDGVRDMLHWERGNLPTLVVEYDVEE